MIHITQGHEKGIGLEIFIKSFNLLSSSEQKKIVFHTTKTSLKKTFKNCQINYSIDGCEVFFSGNILSCNWIEETGLQSTNSLLSALSSIKEKDILLTMPTSKDQLYLNSKQCAGYTEFLRKKYNCELSMLFSSDKEKFLLITDHIPLSRVHSTITEELIFEKVKQTINHHRLYFHDFDEVIFAGINPHCGENGILGTEDNIINNAISSLSKEFTTTSFKGPFSGDTLHVHTNSKNQLFVYMFHDQGLPVFKSHNYVVGLNVTLGLPFLRMSVDHGTAFNLYGKNKANFLGCHYLLKQAINILRGE